MKSKGKGKGRSSRRGGDSHAGDRSSRGGNRTADTAPHILAALAAQRARSKDQQRQQPEVAASSCSRQNDSNARYITDAAARGSMGAPSLSSENLAANPGSQPQRHKHQRASDGENEVTAPLPGFYFDRARNRYFKTVPGVTQPSSCVYPSVGENRTKRRRDDNLIGTARSANRNAARNGFGKQLRETQKVEDGSSRSRSYEALGGDRRDEKGINASSSPGCSSYWGSESGKPVAAAETTGTAGRAGNSPVTSRKRGNLHLYVMNRRRGLYDGGGGGWALGSAGSRLSGWCRGGEKSLHAVQEAQHGRDAERKEGPPATQEGARRTAVESVVSSPRFQLRATPELPLVRSATAMDWHADNGLLALGSVGGELCVGFALGPVLGSFEGGPPFRPRRAKGPRPGVLKAMRVLPHESQVSDIKFRAGDSTSFACAAAWLGGAGRPGSVRAWYDQPGTVTPANVADDIRSARMPTLQLQKGSVWCVEWDPLSPNRLAIGPSSNVPFHLWDVETGKITSIAKLTSDVFSIAYLSQAAPGAGYTLLCGLRNGAVVLLDSRMPQASQPFSGDHFSDAAGSGHINPASSLWSGAPVGPGGWASSAPNVGRNSSRSGFSLPGSILDRRHARSGRSTVAAIGQNDYTDVMPVAILPTSVDHMHVLRDGRRCLVRDRSGGLQMFDLRGGSGGGSGDDGWGQARGSSGIASKCGIRPPCGALVKVFVPPAPRRWAGTPGKFALDPGETVVASPIPPATRGRSGRSRRGGSNTPHVPSTVASAWDPFAGHSSDSDEMPLLTTHYGGDSDDDRGGAAGGSGRRRPRGAGANFFFPREDSEESGWDRLRISSVSSGDVVSDVVTPFKKLSLARGTLGVRGATGVVGQSGFCHGDVVFRGIATCPRRDARVLVEAALWPEEEEEKQ